MELWTNQQFFNTPGAAWLRRLHDHAIRRERAPHKRAFAGRRAVDAGNPQAGRDPRDR
jgi:hypothetical protein